MKISVSGFLKLTIIQVLGKINRKMLEKNTISSLLHRWGNPCLNALTKPLFDETLNIVMECLAKHQHGRSLLPIECLKDYQLIYNEDDDAMRSLQDDKQALSEHLTGRSIGSREKIHSKNMSSTIGAE
jgi:hypothetical protein